MKETVLKNLDKINELREARIRHAADEAKRKEKQLRDSLAKRQTLGSELEKMTEGLDESINGYLKIKEKTAAEGFDKLQAKTREKHLSHLQKKTATVRAMGRLHIALEAEIAGNDADIEKTELELFGIWHLIAKVTLKDYERYRPGKARLRVLSELAARKNAEFRVSQGGYPLHIQLDVETKDALLELPLDCRFLDKHLPEIYKIVSEYRDLDFAQKFLHISYLSVRGLNPEGVTLTVKDRPPLPACNFRESSIPEIETKE
ncbi:hypothetical protein ES703_62272 [subsurface metagenome]